MIVAMTVLLLLMAITLAGYSKYNDKQKVKQASLTLKSDLRLARTNAVSGKKPDAVACTGTLIGYVVTFTSTTYTVTPRCSNALVVDDHVTVTLPDGVFFKTIPSSFTYLPLTQGVSTPPTNIIMTDGSSDGKNDMTLILDAQTGEVSN